MISPKEIPVATANLLFSQYFGGIVLSCIAKTILLNALGTAVNENLPGVDASLIVQSGATEVAQLVGPENADGIVKAYNKALTLTYVCHPTRSYNSGADAF